MLAPHTPAIASRVPFGRGTNAGRLLVNDPAGLGVSFETAVPEVLVRWPSNRTKEFLDNPNDLLTYTSPSTKYVMNSSGILVPGTTLRTDHDADGTALGLLIEEARTNLLTYSEQFDNAAWSLPAGTTELTASAASAPNGSQAATKIVNISDTSRSPYVYQDVTIAGGSEVTETIYAKAAGYSWAIFRFFVGGAYLGPASFNLATGSASTPPAGVTTKITSCSDGWYRIEATFTTDAADTFARVMVLPAKVEGQINYIGDGSSGIYIWGAQLEAGSFPTSYIKTEGSQVTRNVDDITIPQADFPWNSGTGTLTINGSTYTPETSGTDFDIAQTCIVNDIEHLKTLTWVPS